MSVSEHTRLIKEESRRLGFSFCGISKAEFLEEEAPRLEAWLQQGKQGEMSYMDRYFDKRLDPRLLVPGARSVVSFLLNYFPSETQKDTNAPKISKYAYGKDYHIVIKEKLGLLLDFIRENIGEVDGRAFVDSAPVMDKAWAKRSGLGWIGKNSNLISPQSGSFFFIAELILDLDLEYDTEIKDYCGSCTACIEACPTEAISEPYVVDGSKCISYFTIELKDSIPNEMKGKFDNWAFGCDVCQDVCPWNSFSTPHKEKGFAPKEGLLGMNAEEWNEITEEVFKRSFSDSAISRAKYKGLKRNLDFLKSGSPS